MIDKKTLQKVVFTSLRSAGFHKRGQSWYLNENDVLVIVKLERIDLFIDGQYAINIGFWVKALGEPPEAPKFYHSHLYYRVERFFPQQRELILTSCSLSMSNPQLLLDLSGFIENQLVPFLFECTKEKKLKELMAQGALEDGLVRKEARQYLSGE